MMNKVANNDQSQCKIRSIDQKSKLGIFRSLSRSKGHRMRGLKLVMHAIDYTQHCRVEIQVILNDKLVSQNVL